MIKKVNKKKHWTQVIMTNSGQMVALSFLRASFKLQVVTIRIWVKNVIKRKKTSNRKEVELCLQYISSLKLPQREALMNIGPINASI